MLQSVKSFFNSKFVKLNVLLGAGYFTMSQCFATDIISYNSTTGVTWDFSTILTGLMSVVTGAAVVGGAIFLVMTGWHLFKRFCK